MFVQANLMFPTPKVHAQSLGVTLSASGTATVDAVKSSNEPYSCTGTVTQGAYAFNFCEMNDLQNDYYYFQINDLTDSLAQDVLFVHFDNQHTGVIPDCASGTYYDALEMEGFQGGTPPAYFHDYNYCIQYSLQGVSRPYDSVMQGGGANLFTAGVGRSFEFWHPLCSGDSLDYCLSPGSTVGWCLTYQDAGNVVIEYPSGCFTQARTHNGDASKYGAITKVGAAPSSPCTGNQVAMDLSTGTNGSPNAQPVGTQEGASRWRLTSWSTTPPLPSYLLPIVNPPRSIDPAYVGNGQFMPLPWATNPYVITQSPPAGSLLPNGGGPPGRINWITWNETDATVNGVNYPVGSIGTLPADRQPQGTYTYQIPFNVNSAGGQLYVYAVAGADSVTLTTVGPGTPPLPLTAGASAWVPTSPSITTFTVPGSYNLQADVSNSLLAPNHYSAFAVYAVFCSNPVITTTTQLNGTICVFKFNDTNANGIPDGLETGLTGWTFQITNPSTGNVLSATTNSTGKVCIGVAPGTYTVSEVPQTGWTQTAPPPPGTYTVTISPNQLLILNFGNTKNVAPSGCDLAVTKTAAPSLVQPGQHITFTITVTNVGTGACSGTTTLTDTSPSTPSFGFVFLSGSGWACTTTSCQTTATFSPGQSSTLTTTTTATAAVGTYTNCATVSNPNDLSPPNNPANNQACATVNIQTAPSGCDLAVTKTITPNPITIGQTATVTITVKNVGNQPCAGGSFPPVASFVQDNLPSGLKATFSPLGPFNPGWVCGYSVPGDQVSCGTQSPLPSPYTLTFSFQVKAVGPAGSNTNCATVGTNYSTDIDPSNNKSCVTVPILAPLPCDRMLNKTITPISGPSGQTVTIAITVTDVSGACPPESGHGILIADNLPSGMTAVAGSVSTPLGWTCQFDGNPSFYCSVIPAMNPGDTATLSFQATASGSAGSTITNCAQITNLDDSNSNNNNACATFKINPCIIATAAYGSDLAAPVQFLRNFRDTEVQKTNIGASFMAAFNNWYYSWAPGVAQLIAPNENYKAATRVIIAPLIGSLFVGNAVFSVLAPLSPEMAIVSAGLLSSALIGLAYLTPAYALAWKLSKRKITKRTIYCLALAAAALTFIATLTTGTFNIAATLTAVAVVEAMLLTPALVLRKVSSHFIQRRV